MLTCYSLKKIIFFKTIIFRLDLQVSIKSSQFSKEYFGTFIIARTPAIFCDLTVALSTTKMLLLQIYGLSKLIKIF